MILSPDARRMIFSLNHFMSLLAQHFMPALRARRAFARDAKALVLYLDQLDQIGPPPATRSS